MNAETFAARKKHVTAQLGEAVFAAVGLMVRQYMSAGAEEYTGEENDEAARQEADGAGAESGAVNESFDMERYRQLGGEAEEAEEAARVGAPRPAERMRTEEPRMKVQEDGARIAMERAREKETDTAQRTARERAAAQVQTVEAPEESTAEKSRGAARKRTEEPNAVQETEEPRTARETEEPRGTERRAETVREVERAWVKELRAERETEKTSGAEQQTDAERTTEPMRAEELRAERAPEAKRTAVRTAEKRSDALRAAEDIAWEWTGTETSIAPRSGRERREAALIPTGEAERADARALSDEIERDARRYDGGFYLY